MLLSIFASNHVSNAYIKYFKWINIFSFIFLDLAIKQTNRKTYFGQTQLLSSSSSSTSAILGHEHKISKNKNLNNDNFYIRGINHNYINNDSNNDKLSVSSTVHNDSKNKSIKRDNYNNNSNNNNINNINSLYYSTTNQKFKAISQSYSSSSSSSLWDNNKNTNSNKHNKSRKKASSDKSQAQQTWSYHVLPSLYSIYQKVDR